MKCAIKYFLVFTLLLSIVPQMSVSGANLSPFDEISFLKYDETNGNLWSNGDDLVGVNESTYAVYKNMNFSVAPYGVEVFYGVDKQYLPGNKITFRLDSITGPELITLNVTTCGGWGVKTAVTGDMTNKVTGIHTVYVTQTQPNDLYTFRFLSNQKGDTGYQKYSYQKKFTDTDDSFTNEIETINDLGLMNGYSTNQFAPDMLMSRGDFSKVICAIYTNEIPKSEESPFKDVLLDNANYDAINYLYQLGVITGDSNGNFHPFDFMNTIDAVVIACKILGYDDLAKLGGGYPQGYLTVAIQQKLLKGLKTDEFLRRGTAAKLIYNIINAKYLGISTVDVNGNATYEKIPGILSSTKQIYNGVGKVNANRYTSLFTPQEMESEYVIIGDDKYSIGTTSAATMLGIECNFYYIVNNDENILTSIAPRSSVEELVVTTTKHKVSEISNRKMIYYDENDKKYEVSISPSAAFIFNNKAIDKSIEKIVAPQDFRGEIRCIDNGNGYETIMIDSYQNILVDSMDGENKIFRDEFSGQEFDVSEMELFVFDGTTKTTLKKISRGDIFTMYLSKNTSGKQFCLIYLQKQILEGTIVSISEDDIFIENNKYKMAMESDDNLYVGLTATFSINEFGEIVTYKSSASSGKLFACYNGFKIDPLGQTEVKLLISNGTFKTFQLADKITIDGVKSITSAEVENGKGLFQGLKNVEKNTPILYKISNNKIFMMDTYLDGTKNENDVIRRLETPSSSGYYYVGTTSTLRQGGMNRFVLRDSAQVVRTSENREAANYIGNYKSMMGEDDELGNLFYSFDRNSDFIDAIFLIGTARELDADCILVDKLRTVLQDNGEIGLQICGYQGKAYVKKMIHSENITYTNYAKELKCGDIIQPWQDDKGEIVRFAIRFLHDGRTSTDNGQYPTLTLKNGSLVDQNMNNNHFFGTVIGIQDDFLKVQIKNSDNITYIKMNSAGINKVYYKDGEAKIESGISKSTVNVGDIVVAWCWYTNFKQITIYDDETLK